MNPKDSSNQILQKYELWLHLRMVPGLTRNRYVQLIRQLHQPDKIIGLGVERLRKITGVAEPLAELICKGPDPEIIKQELELLESHQARLCCLHDEDYPINLRNSMAPPPLLYYQGNLNEIDRFSIAIVGTRRFSQYGRLACEKICNDLAESGIVIVSGMARGIDSIAHQCAIKNNSRTIAVLGNGLANCYPPENEGLKEQIIDNGLVISDYPMQTGPERYNFPERNRTIAALTLGTAIIEAPEKSGSIITASHALEENREVYAVPGDISRQNSSGTNRLIQQGAKLITSTTDIIQDLQYLLGGLISEIKEKKNQQQIESLDDQETLVYNCLVEEPIQIDLLLQKVAEENPNQTFDISNISAILFQLEIKNLVKQLPGQIYSIV